ncbi:MAG: TonB-dependent receptor, partial [Sediminibacterium sp.]|nr:TonB-dependent receptor [Sediminibacterium sp.]
MEVVTAFGIKKSPKSLTYSIANVSGKEIANSQKNNLVNGLQGRVAGLSISPTNGLAGSSNQIVLRGFNSLYDNSPLFIIDGVVVNNSSVQENNPNTGLISGRGENRQNDYANRINDISPEDIESVSVLKGPEATALYGSQASSGAIIITLRKGGSTNGKINVSYNPNLRISKFQNLPSIFYGYNAGNNGVNADVFSYFGTKISDTTKTFDNINNFFGTGISNNQNISLDYGTAEKNIRASINYLDDKSPVPNNTYKRINYTLTGFYKYKNLLDLTASSSLIFSENIKPLRGINGFLQSLYIWPENNDIRNWKNQDQTKIPLFNANPNADQDNPLYSAYKVRSGEKVNRISNSLSINIYPTKWVTLAGRFGYETYNQENYTQYDSNSFFISRILKGAQDNYYKKYYGYNHTITATFNHSIKDYNFKFLLGTMYQNYEDQIIAVSGNGLLDFNRTDSGNISTSKLYNNNFLKNRLPNYSIYRQFAVFAEFSVNWQKKIFFNSTIRKEESSVFPEKNRNYYYPSAGLSLILTELFPTLNTDFLSYWKLRTTLANTARAISPYSNQAILQPNLGSGGGYNYGFTKANENLKPERQETFEIGTEITLFSNRLKLDVTYYQNTNYDLIFENFRSSYGTGFILNTLNVGVNQNKG